MNFRNLRSLFAALAVMLVTGAAQAQSIDEALRLYKNSDYKDAALSFFDVLRYEANPDVRDQATIYLAKTLRKLEIYAPAFFYYNYIYESGGQNRYYLNAVEELLDLQQEWHDPVVIANQVNSLLDSRALKDLNPIKQAQVNYMVGEFLYRKGVTREAKLFLEYVVPESPHYPHARFLLGLAESLGGNGPAAVEHFRGILRTIDEDDDDPERARVRNLALLAAGRTAYGEGQFGEAIKYYKSVPRFTQQWFTAMYEAAWAYFLNEDYGRALGELQSITSPYFEKRHVPEAYVIAGTAFFVNCQWDRVRREVGSFKENYEPMIANLKAYLGESRELTAYYDDAVAGGNGRYSVEIAREVRRIRTFSRYHFMLSHMDWEKKFIADTSEWQNSTLSEYLNEVLTSLRAQVAEAAGAWVRKQLQERLNFLESFRSQINILDFEVADAERRWLQKGQEINKGRRARLPRPKIPSDQWQHWSFDREYWKDELGYIQHTIATECTEEGEG